MNTVLIVEDSSQLADSVAHQLVTWHRFDVTCVRDPHAMRAELARRPYDVVLIDLLFQHLNDDFEERRKAHRVRLSSPSLLITGLTAVQTVQEVAPTTAMVVWTLGEANRRLHILFAYEDLGQRTFCSKNSGREHADAVAESLRCAVNRVSYVDPVLNAYLPSRGAPAIGSTLLRDESKRAIWRAIALGAHTRAAIAGIWLPM